MNAQATHFSQSEINALRNSPDFKEWNAKFDSVIASIRRQVSPRDLQPILKAGAEEVRLLSLLAWIVYDSDECLSLLAICRKQMYSLAAQLITVGQHASRIVNDPLCDGRFWIAMEGLLSWDEVPIPGLIEASALKRILSLAELIKGRAEALGGLSRTLKRHIRVRAMGDLLAYVWVSTKASGMNFDSEITYLLSAAYRAVGQNRHFTVDQIKKFRQRNLPDLRNLGNPPSSAA